MVKTILFCLIILNFIQHTQQGRRKLRRQPSFLPGIPEQRPQAGAVIVHTRLKSTQPRQLQKLERYVLKKNEQGQGLFVKSKEFEHELISKVHENNFNDFSAKLQHFLQQMDRFLREIEAKILKNIHQKPAIKILSKLQSIKLKILRRYEVMEVKLTSGLDRVRQKSVMEKYGPVAGPYRLLEQKCTTQMLQLMKTAHKALSLKSNEFLQQKFKTLLEKIKQTLRELDRDIAVRVQKLESDKDLLDSLENIKKDLQQDRQFLTDEIATSIQSQILRLRKAKAAKETEVTEATETKKESSKESGLGVRKTFVSCNKAFQIHFPKVEKIEVSFRDRQSQLQRMENQLDKLMEAGPKQKKQISNLLQELECLEYEIVRNKNKLSKAFRYSPKGLQAGVLETVKRMADKKRRSLEGGLKMQFAKVEVMLTYVKRLRKSNRF